MCVTMMAGDCGIPNVSSQSAFLTTSAQLLHQCELLPGAEVQANPSPQSPRDRKAGLLPKRKMALILLRLGLGRAEWFLPWK